MDEEEQLNALQELLMEAFLEYVNKKHRQVKENEFAKYLNASVGSFNQWLRGNRRPDFGNTIKLAAGLSKINPEYGRRLFDILGYERSTIVSDPDLVFIVDNWSRLDNETRKQIIEHVREESERNKLKPR